MQPKKNSMFATLAGVALVLTFFLLVISMIITAVRISRWGYTFRPNVTTILLYLGILFLAVTCFLNQRNILPVVAAAFLLLIQFIIMISGIVSAHGVNGNTVLQLFHVLKWVLFALVMAAGMLEALKSMKPMTKFLCFVPAALHIILTLISLISNIVRGLNVGSIILSFFIGVFFAAGLLLAGLWAAEDENKVKAAGPTRSYAGLTPEQAALSRQLQEEWQAKKAREAWEARQAQAAQQPIQPAEPAQPAGNDKNETLRTFQDLLVKGLITEEEYEAKRKELMGE